MFLYLLFVCVACSGDFNHANDRIVGTASAEKLEIFDVQTAQVITVRSNSENTSPLFENENESEKVNESESENERMRE
jgi:hypothetical protein